jgi:hypothetical protein
VGQGDTLSAGKKEATESRGEGQQRGKRGEGKEARAGGSLAPTPSGICIDVNTKDLQEKDSEEKSVASDQKGSEP